MSPEAALAELAAGADPEKAAQMAAYHKAPRQYLGVANPAIDTAVKRWRAVLGIEGRLELARGLWRSDIHEARIAAAKLLTQARIRELEAEVWAEIESWVPSFDAWAIADHAAAAGARRLRAFPERLDIVEGWVASPHLWTRRAAFVFTLPWTKSNHPTPAEEAARDRILGWAAALASDREWFIQKAIAWWVRELSKHDAQRARAFLETHGARLKPFARREAGRYLQKVENQSP